MYTKDSNGDINPLHIYNAAHFDGTKWNYVEVPCGVVQLTQEPIYVLYPAQSDDIWFQSASGLASRLKNGIWVPVPNSLQGEPLNGGIWGSSSANMYFSGMNGVTFHFDGDTYTRLYPTTKLFGVRICGSRRGDGTWEVIGLYTNGAASPPGMALAELDGSAAQRLDTTGIDEPNLVSLWCKAGVKYYVGGYGIFSRSSLTKG
jgi:hypothetical protein